MELQMIVGPLLGAVIGYCTNYIAVKMLFRPLRPVKIGRYTLPFTPGIIPKGKERLGKAIGAVVGNTLLTQESMKEVLLSDSMKAKIGDTVDGLIEAQKGNETELGTLSDGIGDGVASEVMNAIVEAVQGSFLAMVVNEKLLENFREPIVKKVNEVTIGKIVTMVSESEVQTKDYVIQAYGDFVEEKLGDFLQEINITQIVENKVNEMDVLEVEELLLSIMKKELNAVVNLGALIGLVIGLVNLFF